jgi:hypothetical protein
MIHFSGKFCHDLLKKTAQWTMRTSLVDVVKAIVERIDTPDLDEESPKNDGLLFFNPCVFSLILFSLSRSR